MFALNEELRRSDEAFFNRPPSAGSNHDNAADADRNDGSAADDINAGRETQDEEDLVQKAENVQDLGDSASTLSLSSQAAAAEDVDDGKLALQDEQAVSHNPSANILTPPDGIPSSSSSVSNDEQAGADNHVVSIEIQLSTDENDATIDSSPKDGTLDRKNLLDDAMFSNDYEAITDFNQVENEDISDNEDQIFLDENGAEVEILDQRETESGVQIAVNYKGETVWVMKRKKGEFYVPHVHPEWASFERYGDAVYKAPNSASDKEDLYGLTRSGDKEDELLHDDKGRLYSEGGQYLMSGGLPFIGEGVNPEIDDDYDKRLGYWSSDEDSEEDSRDEGDDDSGESNDDQAGNDDDVGEGSGDDNGSAVGQEIDPSLETPGLRHLVPSTDDARKSSAPDNTVSHPSKIASPAGMEEEKSEITASETQIPTSAVFGPSSTASNSSAFPSFDVRNQTNKPAFANQ